MAHKKKIIVDSTPTAPPPKKPSQSDATKIVLRDHAQLLKRLADK